MSPSEAQKIAWHTVRTRLQCAMRERIVRAGLWPDVQQEVAVASWQACKEGWTARELSNAVNRAAYHLLRDMGFMDRVKDFDPIRDEPRVSASIQTVVLVGECGIKKCHACRKYLPVESFAFDGRRGDRLTLKCRACQAAVNRRSYERRRGGVSVS